MKTYELADVLRRTSQSIEEHGWKSGGDAYRDGTTSTASRVKRLLESGTEGYNYVDEEIDSAIEWASGYRTSDRDYLVKIADLACTGTVSEKGIGFAVSILSSYRKDVARTEAFKQFEDSNWVGEVGERTTMELELLSIKWLDRYDYGNPMMCRFLANGTDVVVWFASNPPLELSEASVGDSITLKGTVKKHDEFRDTKQTVLTRCKVETVDGESIRIRAKSMPGLVL